VVLILINVGVFVLFVMAVWTIVRGVLGLKDLLEGRAIRHPLRLSPAARSRAIRATPS